MVSDIPAGDGKIAKLFYSVSVLWPERLWRKRYNANSWPKDVSKIIRMRPKDDTSLLRYDPWLKRPFDDLAQYYASQYAGQSSLCFWPFSKCPPNFKGHYEIRFKSTRKCWFKLFFWDVQVKIYRLVLKLLRRVWSGHRSWRSMYRKDGVEGHFICCPVSKCCDNLSQTLGVGTHRPGNICPLYISSLGRFIQGINRPVWRVIQDIYNTRDA